MKKRILLIVLSAIIVLSGVLAFSCNSYYGCNCGKQIESDEGLLYTLNIGKTEYAVTGYKGTEKDVVIDSVYENLPVTSIGNVSFYRNEDITSVIIPDSVTRIGWYAFYQCTNLVSITIPNSVTKIGWDALRYCFNLTDIRYTGTKEEWNKIGKGFQWSLDTPATVHCSDGDIEL